MNLGPALLTVAVVMGGACTSDARSAATTIVGNSRTATTEVVASTIDLARECIHTDPGRLPVSVHRALSCPDGTSVSVQGVATTADDGSVTLCDPAPSEFCLTIDGAVPMAADSPTGAAVGYTGTVSHGVLTVGRAPRLDAGPFTPSP